MPKNIPGLVQRRYRRPVETTPIIIPPRPLPVMPAMSPPTPPIQEGDKVAPHTELESQYVGNGAAPPAQSRQVRSDEPIPQEPTQRPMAKTAVSPSPLPDTPPYLEPLHTLSGPNEAQQARPISSTPTLANAGPPGIQPGTQVPPVARVLVKINGQVVGETHLTKPELSIGRRDGSDIHVAHPGVSRLHAKIRAERGTWIIEDTNSANGMRYHGQHVKHLTLNNGDVVLLAPNVALMYETAP